MYCHPATHAHGVRSESTVERKYGAHDESKSDLQVDIFNAQTTDIKPATAPSETHLAFAEHHADIERA